MVFQCALLQRQSVGPLIHRRLSVVGLLISLMGVHDKRVWIRKIFLRLGLQFTQLALAALPGRPPSIAVVVARAARLGIWLTLARFQPSLGRRDYPQPILPPA